MTSERAALLIADIGGYTEYMSTHRMTLAHAEVNTARILDRMIEAARGFDLIEIEGDAAFLARRADSTTPDPTVLEILRAATAMHTAFHLERQHVATNLCPCGGCREAGNLKLKFVAHVGEVAEQNIRGRKKLVGIDVIQIHRMLKNSVKLPEYVLLSEELYRSDAASVPSPVQQISSDLEGIGTVRSYFVDVVDLDGTLPVLPKPSLRSRLGNTLSAVGAGLPYMLGTKQYRRPRYAK
jgi:hypothetical protein